MLYTFFLSTAQLVSRPAHRSKQLTLSPIAVNGPYKLERYGSIADLSMALSNVVRVRMTDGWAALGTVEVGRL